MIVKATSKNDIETIVELGKIIWNQHYVPIIGQDQVDYMLEKFQSIAALTDQIENQDYHYFIIKDEGSIVGYMGLQKQTDQLFLSKLYLLDSARGKGLGKKGMKFCLKFAREHGFSKLGLTVNKYNKGAIIAYEKTGFIKTASIVTDIGQGYVMDDYAFEMSCD